MVDMKFIHLETIMRKSGILLHITSLPNPYGIGTFGKSAYQFVDFLKKAKQSYWQILPLGPTSYGDSPYQTFSAYAINPYFIDLDSLIEEKLLTKKDIVMHKTNPKDINYGALYHDRFEILRKAFKRFSPSKAYTRFLNKHQHWLEDYALFMALKSHYNGQPFNTWDHDIKVRNTNALNHYKETLKEEIRFHQFIQFKAFQQWMNLKNYANLKGIEIIGDIPIYVAYDSSDVWTHPEYFELNEAREMTHVAGVPPDGFSADGQLWGNPLYNWEYLDQHGYTFWLDRMRSQLTMYDMLRIDHFIGFEHYYAIPFGKPNAREGSWHDGPSKKLFEVIKKELGTLNIIAEDLGRITPRVIELLAYTGFPGMKLTQFAFGDEGNNATLPHGFSENTIAYTGTHDNETTKSWFKHINLKEKKHILEYLNMSKHGNICEALIRETLKSRSKIAIIPIQDYLELGDEGRMNEPSTIGKNWRYRVQYKDLTMDLQKRIAKLTKLYGRHLGQKNEGWIDRS